MLNAFVEHVAAATGVSSITARSVLGIVLNAAERQGAGLAEDIYGAVQGARALSAQTGVETGAATGVIARLIEQTPGGREAVTEQMIRNLQKAGLGHAQIGALLPAIGAFAEGSLGIPYGGHLGDVLGGGLDGPREIRSVA